MRNSLRYKIFLIVFLILFSFFHVGYAAVEYLCGMGMDMNSPNCVSCHTDTPQTDGMSMILSSSDNRCCTSTVKSIDTVDTYTIDSNHTHSPFEHAIAHLDTLVPEQTAINTFTDFSPDLLPSYTLMGICTSIQYSSFLR